MLKESIDTQPQRTRPCFICKISLYYYILEASEDTEEEEDEKKGLKVDKILNNLIFVLGTVLIVLLTVYLLNTRNYHNGFIEYN